jgi:hypothetical protein
MQPAICTRRHWFLHDQSICEDLHSRDSNSHAEVRWYPILLEDKAAQIVFKLMQNPYSKHVWARLIHDGVSMKMNGS